MEQTICISDNQPRFAWLGALTCPAARYALDIKIARPGECNVRLAGEQGAGPAYANTARPCFASPPRGFATATHPLALGAFAPCLLHLDLRSRDLHRFLPLFSYVCQ
ncbi:hypothetical protein JG687_00013958 [Phytophthora cactorum]|uniref:Uncharacterized protein n=1 Tax=Phytophthora cactorum TaxID=29920 RepID=A0A8T1TYX9_9STRA|nr:hypothetical protein JG687_00013958 [Phytophthora cactorum]